MKIAFVDFWPNFRFENNYFFHLLKDAYDLEINQRNPDLIFLTTDPYRLLQRKKFVNSSAIRVFWTMESTPPRFDSDSYPPVTSIITRGGIGYGDPHSRTTQATNDSDRSYYYGRCDFALTHDVMDDPRHYRLPWWTGFIDWFKVGNYGADSEPSFLNPPEEICSNKYIHTPKTKFCAHMVSNPVGNRMEAHKKISAYKKVDGLGNCFGGGVGLSQFHGVNTPWEEGKLEFLKDYRFSICFENVAKAGYHTEKLLHAKIAGNIPIYWGASTVSQDFNPDCFINLNDFESIDAMVERIKEIDQNETLYKQYAEAPLFVDGVIPDKFKPEAVLNFFKETVLRG